MKSVRKNYHLLKLLQSTTPSQRQALLKTITPSQLHSICEVCYNVLHGNVPVKVSKIKKYKSVIRKLGDKKVSNKRKKNILVNQAGGFLPYIIPAVIGAIGSLFQR